MIRIVLNTNKKIINPRYCCNLDFKFKSSLYNGNNNRFNYTRNSNIIFNKTPNNIFQPNEVDNIIENNYKKNKNIIVIKNDYSNYNIFTNNILKDSKNNYDNNSRYMTATTTSLLYSNQNQRYLFSKSTNAYSSSKENDDKKGLTIKSTKKFALSRVDKAVNWVKKIPKKIVDEIKHYYHGSKLLFYEISACKSLLGKVVKGTSLTRRERRQLIRTTNDLLRLIPMAIFVIIPLMEFLLPFALMIFPNMLPSTFQDSMKREENRKKKIQAKIQVAKFLQEAVNERAKSLRGHEEELAKEFEGFLAKIRKGGRISEQDLIRFSKLFEDDFTLDNISRDQLVHMCKFMNITAFGTDAFLRYLLRNKLKKIKADDIEIRKEGVESLDLSELQQACVARGLQGGNSRSMYFLQQRLEEWLSLSLDNNLPLALLIYANAIKITASISATDALREALYKLPTDLEKEIRLRVSENSGNNESQLKLELLKKELEQIKQEDQLKEITDTEISNDKRKAWILEHKDIAQSSVNFSSRQLLEIIQAVHLLASNPNLVENEKENLEQLKLLLEMRSNEIASIESKQEEIFKQEEKEAEANALKESISLAKQLEGKELESKDAKEILLEDEEEEYVRKRDEKQFKTNVQQVKQLKEKIDSLLHEVNIDLNKELSNESNLKKILDNDNDGVVSVDEIESSLKKLKDELPDKAVKVVVGKLDLDSDGKISLDELKKLTEYIDEADNDHLDSFYDNPLEKPIPKSPDFIDFSKSNPDEDFKKENDTIK